MRAGFCLGIMSNFYHGNNNYAQLTSTRQLWRLTSDMLRIRNAFHYLKLVGLKGPVGVKVHNIEGANIGIFRLLGWLDETFQLARSIFCLLVVDFLLRSMSKTSLISNKKIGTWKLRCFEIEPIERLNQTPSGDGTQSNPNSFFMYCPCKLLYG